MGMDVSGFDLRLQLYGPDNVFAFFVTNQILVRITPKRERNHSFDFRIKFYEFLEPVWRCRLFFCDFIELNAGIFVFLSKMNFSE